MQIKQECGLYLTYLFYKFEYLFIYFGMMHVVKRVGIESGGVRPSAMCWIESRGV